MGLLTTPIAGDLTDFQPTTLGSATSRSKKPPNPSLLLARAQRALRRQVWLFVVLAVLLTGAGVAFDIQGGMLRPLAAVLFWAPIGLGAALLIAVLRELGRGVLTFPAGLTKHRGYAVLGAAPELSERMLRELAPDKRSPLGCVTFQHASPFAVAYRDLQAALRDDHLLAFISPFASEGATTTALCAAVSATQQGRRVIIVDCDTRRRSLTKALGVEAEKGVMECCEDPSAWRDYVQEEAETGLPILPAARMRNAWRTLAGASGLRDLIAALREEYDLVILDCPPALRSGDGPVLASLAEKCVAVAAWDQTQLAALRQTVRTLQHRSGVKTAVYVNRVPAGYRYERPAR
jgi:Mrp family chromosome partitioning ATPase